MIEQPLVIVGTPRSGTSMLGGVLSRHPDVWYANEPQPIWRLGNEHRSDILRPEFLTGRIRARILGHFEQQLRRHGKSRLLEKSPQNCLRLPFVDAVFPDARYVMIHRDAMESCLSIEALSLSNTVGLKGVRLKTRLKEVPLTELPRYGLKFARRFIGTTGTRPRTVWGPILPGIEQMYRDLQPIEVASLQWRTCVELALDFLDSLPTERVLEIHLKDLTAPVVRDIMAFARWPEDRAVLEAFAQRFDREKTRHRTQEADPAKVKLIEKWIKPTLLMLEQRAIRRAS